MTFIETCHLYNRILNIYLVLLVWNIQNHCTIYLWKYFGLLTQLIHIYSKTFEYKDKRFSCFYIYLHFFRLIFIIQSISIFLLDPFGISSSPPYVCARWLYICYYSANVAICQSVHTLTFCEVINIYL